MAIGLNSSTVARFLNLPPFQTCNLYGKRS